MAKTRTISFVLEGKDNLSAILANAQKNLGGLTSKTLTANAKALANAQAQLKAVENYKKLYQAMSATATARLKNIQDGPKLFKQWQEGTKQLADMRAAYQRLQDVYKATKDSTLKDQLKSAANELKAQEQSVKRLGQAYDGLPAQARKLQEQLSSQRTQLAQLRTSIPSSNVANAEAALRSQIDQTTAALNREIAALERRNQIHQNFSQRQQDLSNAYSNLQGALNSAQTLMNPFTSATEKAIAFQHTMSTLKSISQMDLISAGNLAQAEANMKRLTAQAKELGATTIYTAQQVGEAQVYIARTGWNTDAIEKSMPSILRLAAANRMDIEQTADIVTNVMTAFGHGVDQIGKDTDVFAYTVTHSNQTLAQFGEAMKYAAPVAKLFGASIEEAAMMTKFMGDAGIQGSMAGTSMRQTMLRLTAPPKKASKAMDELGVSTSDATKAWNEAQEVAASYGVTLDSSLSAGRQFISIMEQIDKGMAGKSDREKLSAISAITGVNAVSGAANVFGAGAGQAKNFTELLENCRGALEQTYSVMTDDTFGAQKSFESAWEAVQLSVGESLLGITQTAYNFATPLLNALSRFIDNNPAVVQGLAAIAATASTAIVSIAGFSLAMAGVRFAQAGIQTAGLVFTSFATKIASAGASILRFGTVIRTALTGLSLASFANPITLGLMAIGAAAYYAYNNWDKVSAACSTLGSALSSSIGPAFNQTSQAVSQLMTSLSPLASVFESIGGIIVGSLVGVVGTVGSLLSGVAVGVAGLIKTIAELGTGVADAFAKIKEGDFSGAFDSLTSTASQAAENFKASWVDAFAAVKTGLQGTDAAIQTLMTTPQPSVENFSQLNYQTDTSSITQPLADASTQAADSLTQVQMPAEATGQSLTPLPPSIDGAVAASDNLSAALPTPIEGLNALGPAASSAASALQNAAAQISSIKITVPQVNYVPMSVPVKANAQGGIYNRGTFLTTFAENSAEAAIPLDNSARSRDLWLETGSALGMFNDSSPITFNLSVTVNGAGDNARQQIEDAYYQTIKPSLEEQLNQLRHEQRRRSFA